MKKLITYFKLLKYGLQYRTMMIMTVLFIGMGILFEMTASLSSLFGMSLGGLYMALIGAYMYQLVATVAVAKVVSASPMKKELLTSAPIIMATIVSLVTYTIFILVRLFYTIGIRLPKEAELYPDAEAMLVMSILYCGGLIFVLMIYLPVSFKKYAFGIIILAAYMVFMLVIGNGVKMTSFMVDKYYVLVDTFGKEITLGLVIAASYVMLLLGSFVGYLINCLTIRQEYSEFTYRNALRQAAGK